MSRAGTLRLAAAVVIAVLVRASVAQTPPPPVYSPDVAIEPGDMNLHMLEPTEVKTVEFKVRNTSDKPITIDSVLTTCRCVSVDFDKRPIPPGEAAVARVTVTAATAESRKTIATVYTSGFRRNTARFVIEYTVIPEVFTLPRKADFGRVKVGDKAEIALKVIVHVPKELAEDPVLEPFVAHDLPVKVTLDPPVVTKIRDDTRDLTTTLRLVLDTSKPVASFDSHVVFKPKLPRTYRLTLVRLLGEVRGPAWFEHPQLAFGPVAVGAPTVLSIRLYGEGADPPKVEEAEISPAVFSEKHAVDAASRSIRFDLTCTPEAAGPVTGELRVKVAGCPGPLVLKLSARGK